MSRVARDFCSFLSAFLAGVCLALAIHQFVYLASYTTDAQVASGADCYAREGGCSLNAKVDLKSKHRDAKSGNASQIRIFCWIMVPYMMPLMTMMIINESWGPRCNGFAFVAPRIAVGELNLPLIDVNAPAFEASQFHTVEWKRIWLSAWQLHSNGAEQKYDYFLLVRSKNYVVVENARRMLSSLDPSKPFMLGRRMQRKVIELQGGQESYDADYLTADAGIVLSNGAFAKMVTLGFSGTSSDPVIRLNCGSHSVTKSYDTQ
uniref:N-acetylgalactosaminide beta-1,3-galactosyltransferase n=1 Tax=Macrostomum lignano TaxID=282301 RepID=A0A1I8FTT9_9PLAT